MPDLSKIVKNKVFFAFLAPYMVIFVLFFLWPLISAVQMSLQDFRTAGGFMEPVYIGFENFARLPQDDIFLRVLQNTILLTCSYVVICTATSLGVALLLDRKMRGITFFKAAYFIPWVTAPVVIAVIWRNLLQPYGIADYITQSVGLGTINWYSPGPALFSIVLVEVWRNFGMYAAIILTGLQSIRSEYYEAAMIDGAGWPAIIRHITVPLLKPILFFVIFLQTIGALHEYDLVYSLTHGGPGFSTMTLVYYLYWKGFESFELGYASAIGIVILLISLVITLIQRKLLGTTF